MRGTAVLIVLMAVALVMVLSLAFLALARSEARASSATAWTVQVRTLSDTAVNLAIGQIREATENNGVTKTWASQPGMIRVFGNSNPSGSTGRTELEAAYKLYSDDQMVEIGRFDPDGDLPPVELAEQPGVFVDLNEPVAQLTSDPVPHRVYPIADGRSFEERGGWPMVQGAEIDNSAPLAESNGFTNPVPMPVRWLYMLKDGSVIAAAQGLDEITEFGDVKPSRENPIVGRIAFWTDDETTKVNINTASEGVFWDQPRGNNDHDAYNYADKQPVQGEFQRYPGHPATTSLSPVLGNFIGSRPEDRLKYYALSPRISPGGSLGRSRVVNPSTATITVDRDRLYASIDEYFFAATRLENGDLRSRTHTDLAGSSFGRMERPEVALDKSWLDQSRFFLTAHSRAPEVNLFNKPRLSIWPVQQDSGDRNAKDQLGLYGSKFRHPFCAN
ncbi:MAG: Verru_Chthon cassette protein A [Verrucomicrobiota bacterium]